MPIPNLDANGHLPPGVHECTFEELEDRFGRDQWVENRLRPCRSLLCARLEEYVAELQRVGVPGSLIVDGSFVTGKPEPGDIDLILVLPADRDFVRVLIPREYNAIVKHRVQDRYPFDLFVVAEGTVIHRERVAFFQQIEGFPDQTKGILRLKL